MTLPAGPFSILYADPPWDYGREQHTKNRPTTTSGGAASHYPVMSEAEICELPVADICAADALLFLWMPGPKIEQAIATAAAWGFSWVTVAFVWDKCATNPGFYTLSEAELVGVFKRGRIPQPRGSRIERQLIRKPRTRHSEKPPEVRDAIARMFPGHPMLELFARQRSQGWIVWGNEISEAAPPQLQLFNGASDGR